jgi:hypothetical protein
VHPRHTFAFVFSALTAIPLAGACGDSVTTIVCPIGTRPEGSVCVPIDGADTGQPADTAATDSAAPGDTSAPDGVGEITPSDETSSDDGADATPGPTGASCVKNAECAGGTCLNWTGGYCTALDCDAGSCGAGATCVTLAGNHLCLAECASDADCAATTQRCKALDAPAGADASATIVHVCVAVAADAAPIGAGCASPLDCAGAATCLASFPGGYCGILGCTATSCPADAACVKVDQVPTCLAGCAGDGDCHSVEGAERKCGVLPGIDQTPLSVCVSGLSGKDMGVSCLSDFECASGACQILGEGRCSNSERPCSTATAAADCTAAEFCRVGAQSRVGVCSQPCAASGAVACPGASFCVADGWDGKDAWCRPACTAPGADAACNAAAGLSCGYGIPISDGGGGRYVCTRVRTGVPLAVCTGDAECGGATCLRPDGGGQGTCGAGCGEDGYCPFGGLCGDLAGAPDGACYRACLTIGDCPSGFGCARTGGSAWPVCAP